MDKELTRGSFTKLIAASGFSNLADGIGMVVWTWVATLITRDPFLVSLVPVALRLPWFLFAIPAGILADRMDRRHLVLTMDILRVVAFCIVAFSIWAMGPLDASPQSDLERPRLFLAVVGAALIVGVAEVFRDSAAQIILPSIVPADRLEWANGRLWSMELTGNSLVGPALSALLIGMAPFLPFAVNAVTYAVAAVLILQLAGRFQPQTTESQNWRRELGEGIRFLRSTPLLRLLAYVTGAWNLLFQMVFVALFLHGQENIGVGATVFGIILAAGAVGGILGGLCGAWIIKRVGSGATAAWMLFASAPAFYAIAFAPTAITLAVALFLFEFSGLVWNTVSVSYRQRVIPNALLGRVNSLYRLLAWGMMPLGLMLSGLIVKGAEGMMTRDWALIMPFLVAGSGALFLALAASRPLWHAFDAQ